LEEKVVEGPLSPVGGSNSGGNNESGVGSGALAAGVDRRTSGWGGAAF
jgi:hypothetical protein